MHQFFLSVHPIAHGEVAKGFAGFLSPARCDIREFFKKTGALLGRWQNAVILFLTGLRMQSARAFEQAWREPVL